MARMGKASKVTGDMPSCCRCTALLHGTQPRCSLCGWPVGSAYPQVEGAADELPLVATATATADEAPAVDEAVGAQLDALSAMAVRNHDRAADTPEPAVTTAYLDVEVPAEEAGRESEPELVLAHAGVVTDEAGGGATDVLLAPDPLTAPIEQLVLPVDTHPRVDETWHIESGVDHDPNHMPDDSAAARELVAPETSTAEPSEREGSEQRTGRRSGLTSLGQVVRAVMLVVGVGSLALAGIAAVAGPATDVGLVQALSTLGLALVVLGCWLAAGALFLIWVSRAHAVAASATFPQRYSRGMAVGGWLIPVYGLVVGWNVLCDLWTASDPATRDASPDNAGQPPLLVGWLLGLVGSVALGSVLPVVLGENVLFELGGAVCLLVSALCLGTIVTTIGGRLDPDTTVELVPVEPS
jgi:hypothetical protein